MLRSFLAAVLVLALVPAATLANGSVWASRTVLDTTAFGLTVGRALDTRAAETALAERLSEELLAALLRADDRVRLILGPLVGAGINADDRELVEGLTPRVLEALGDPRAEAARDALIGAIHRAVLRGSAGQGNVRLEDDRLILDVRELLDVVIAALDPRLRQVAGMLVTIGRTEIVLASSPALAMVPPALTTLDRLGLILPLLAVAIALSVVVVAHRRRRGVAIVGLAVAVAGGLGLALVAMGGAAFGTAESAIDPELVSATYDALSADLVGQSILLVAAGVGLALLAGAAAMLPARRRPGAGGGASW